MDTIQQRLILKAAKPHKGFENTRLVNNTTAAATTYRLALDLDIEDSDGRSGTATALKFVVFDLGARGLNVSVVGFSFSGENSKVLVTCEDPTAGGENILQNFIDYFTKDLAVVIQNNKQMMTKLRAACEKAMIKLDWSNSAKVKLELPDDDVGFERLVTRKELEFLNKEVMERCIATVQKSLEEAHLSSNDVNEYLVIGRVSNAKFIKTALKIYFDKTLFRGIQRKSTVWIDTCIQALNFAAAINDEKTQTLSVWDDGSFREVSALEVCVVDSDGNNIVIPKLTQIPFQVVFEFAHEGK